MLSMLAVADTCGLPLDPLLDSCLRAVARWQVRAAAAGSSHTLHIVWYSEAHTLQCLLCKRQRLLSTHAQAMCTGSHGASMHVSCPAAFVCLSLLHDYMLLAAR